jgi:transposase
LREIVGGLQCCEGKLRHLGVESAPVRSTLSYANGRRPWQLFEQLFYQLIDTCRGVAPGKKFRFKNKLLSLDSTIIELCVTMFDWARFQKTKGAVKLHLLLDHDGYLPTYALLTEGRTADLTVAQGLDLPKGSVVVIDRGYNDYLMFERWCAEGVFFVTRLKDNAYYIVSERCPVPERSTILADELIVFQAFQAGRKVVHTYRRAEVWLPDKEESLVLLTNHLDFGPTTIAAIYKERWQIELFFKALKQNLKVKTFVGTSSNAVHIQIWTALIAMALLKYLQFRATLAWSLSNLVALLRWNLITYRDLWKWIDQPFETPPEGPPDPQLSFI